MIRNNLFGPRSCID